MAQAPKKKKKLLPKNIVQQPDAQVAEELFGKKAKQELDRLTGAATKSMREV